MKNVVANHRVKMYGSFVVLAIILLSSIATIHVFASSNTITNAQFSPSDNVVSTYTFYTVKFVLGTTATISNIVLTWPAGYNVATEKFVFESGVPFGTTTATNGPPVKITYCFGSAACSPGGGVGTSESSGDVVTFMFANIENPTTAGSYTPTSICTYDLTTQVECQTSIPSITIADITSSQLASSISIAALSAGTLSVTGSSSFTGAAIFGSTVTSSGLLTANGGISTTNLGASGTLSVTGAASFQNAIVTDGLLTANGGISATTLSTNAICGGAGPLPCGGSFEVDDSGALYAAGGLFSVNTAGDVVANGNVTAENFLTAGQLYVASGTFHVDGSGNIFAPSATLSSTLSVASGDFQVNSAGQITTQSVGFGSLANNALPSYSEFCVGENVNPCSTPSVTAARSAVALVYVTIWFTASPCPSSGTNGDSCILDETVTSSFSGLSWVGGQDIALISISNDNPDGIDNTVTDVYEAFNIAAGTSGTFTSTITIGGGGSDSYSVGYQQVTYLLIPAV